jgi:hypothetical protein
MYWTGIPTSKIAALEGRRGDHRSLPPAICCSCRACHPGRVQRSRDPSSGTNTRGGPAESGRCHRLARIRGQGAPHPPPWQSTPDGTSPQCEKPTTRPRWQHRLEELQNLRAGIRQSPDRVGLDVHPTTLFPLRPKGLVQARPVGRAFVRVRLPRPLPWRQPPAINLQRDCVNSSRPTAVSARGPY